MNRENKKKERVDTVQRDDFNIEKVPRYNEKPIELFQEIARLRSIRDKSANSTVLVG